MYIPLNDILFLVSLGIFLMLVYRKIVQNTDVLETIRQRYWEFGRKQRMDRYIKKINRRPLDFQKVFFKEASALMCVLLIMGLLSTKAIFLTAVASGSMSPTFNTNDIILMQNIEHTYKTGDIIMFERPDTSNPVSHRIVSITKEGIHTAGDATGQVDWWDIKKEDILGKAILMNGKPIVIKGYGKFFIVDDRHQDFGPFGTDYNKYFLFFQVVKIYGYVIAAFSLLLYVGLTMKQKPWQSR
ncbi:MAG: signal peptidase I [Candidatus Methanoperedens sp.]|nr:signal peptidase I [Candidatus Methanoperedens sp.]MCZ7370515.1 signal peptidase I [Candidatus Methanoperedens sp.]